MSTRALARSGGLLRAARVLFAGVLLSVSGLQAMPAAAWQMPVPRLPEPVVQADSLPMVRGSFQVIRPEVDESAAELAAPAPALGPVIAGTALAYVGYPYAAGGNGPGGFDCSGFTQFIVGITTGIWMSHAVEAQPWSVGYWVEYGAWQPGDLIFFQNTYRAGISHAAIYIGDGLIVHAENYGSGVTIDSLYSGYYGPRYWGAIRIG
jgi:hypothetical protein